jgi:hypothetical protein
MVRRAAVAVAVLVGLLAAGCAGGNFGQAGFSLPVTSDDGLQTVSDAADALDAHRASASASAKAAIAVTDAFGSYVREITAAQRMLLRTKAPSHAASRNPVVSHSTLLMRGGAGDIVAYCQSAAGYSANGIPSLDETFGWESGAFSGGTRTTDARGSATWLANATGAVVEGSIGALSVARTEAPAKCPMIVPTYVVTGGDSASAFSIPIAMAFHRSDLTSVTVSQARFANGQSLSVTSEGKRQAMIVSGIVSKGRTQVATFHTNALGSGTLTITSTGAQYVIRDWIVAGT